MYYTSCPYSQYTTVTTRIDEKVYGGNKSAEDEGDGGGDGADEESGVNIVLANRLVETAYSKKKDFQKELKVCQGCS